MSYILYFRQKNTNDTCHYLLFSPKDDTELQSFVNANTTENMEYKVVKKEDLPNVNTSLLGCYKIINGELIIDLEFGKELVRNKLRKQRVKHFSSLDGEFMKALENGDTIKQQEVVAKKKELRNATTHPLIESVKSLEDLHLINIENLI